LGRPRAPFLAESVINATIELLAESGVEGATIDAIATRAGVGKPSIYRRWASRDDLIADVVLRAADRDIPVPDTGSVRGDLLGLLRSAIDALSESLGRASVALVAYAVSHPEIGADAPPMQVRRQTTRIVVERAVARGELPADADADQILDLLIAPVYLTLLVRRGPLDALDAVAIVDTILYGAVKKEKPRRATRRRH
jgi:AcrR family transcriptional regulator